ncbi:hypothetical protein SUGI_1058100 [Cryptomeria japonica]|nr:hypothetical protein SUGI_1058100 [Cryptomeria japonica]
MEIADDLVEEILKRLPLECMFRFRMVCRGWYRLLRELWAEAASKQPAILICLPNANEGCLIYSFLTRKWRPLSLSFLPVPECSINGCGAGLLLLDIPSMAASWGHNRGTYKVLLLGKKCSQDSIEVHGYNSVTNSWNKMGEDYDLGGNSRAAQREETAFCNGFIFLMGTDNVVVFNIEDCRWNRVGMPAGAVVRNNIWPRLVCCGSFLLLVRLIKRAHVLEDVIMWELCGEKQRGDVRWKEKGRMPEWVRGKLQRKWIECVGVGDYVCFRSHGSAEIVVYSLGEGTWQWLPKCTAAFINDSRSRSLAFQQIYSFPPLQHI